MYRKLLIAGAVCALAAGCGKDVPAPGTEAVASSSYYTLRDVAQLLAGVPLGKEQAAEVHDAALSSALNGYDHEYLMKDVFENPGAGIGDELTKAAGNYARPLRDLLREAVGETKAAGRYDPSLLDALENSDVQIYWPYPEDWDGNSLPVVTFDPGNPDDATNVGYLPGGEKVLVDEQMAKERPVWVVSNNRDGAFTSLEMLRREDPSWGQGGGEIIVRPRAAADKTEMKTLVLRSFKAYRQYDSWFAGASEYFVKMGSVTDMTASTEAEMRLYYPSITDFMIVVRRSEVNKDVPFNAVLISEWVKGLDKCAFLITEDDGGSTTNWKCDVNVVYNSKKYGVEINLPVRTRDDIVWRGTLTRGYIEKYDGQSVRFGDVDLVLELI